MPARRRGLGPLGHRAIEEGGASLVRIQEPRVPAPTRNPAALSVASQAPFDPQSLAWYPFDSSRVSEAAYDPQANRLVVRWVKPGLPYAFEGVPVNVWRNFRRSASAGRYVNRVLNQYDYHPEPM